MENTISVVKVDEVVEKVEINFEEKFLEAKEVYEKAVTDFEAEIQAFSEELFVVEGGIEFVNFLIDFFRNHVQWRSTESKMVVKVFESIIDQYEILLKNKDEQFRLKSMDLEAINYLLQKYEDVGLESALKFFNNSEYLRYINEALVPTEEFKKRLDNLRNNIDIYNFKMQSWQHEIEPSPEVDLGLK